MGKRIAQIFTQSGIEDFSTRKTYPCKVGLGGGAGQPRGERGNHGGIAPT